MQQIDSAALHRVSKSLGLSTPGAMDTDLDDAVLQQSLDCVPLIRRGRALGSSQGIFTASIENVHAGAGIITTAIDPYALTSPRAGYPTPLPDGFDVWLLDAFGSAAIGLQDTDASRITVRYDATQTALGPVGTVTQPYRLFLGEIPISAAVAFLQLATGSVALGPLRIPRGADILWSSAATGAGSMFGQLVLGVFPEALGQDGLG